MTRSIRWRPTTRRSSPRSKESIPRLCTTAGARWRESIHHVGAFPTLEDQQCAFTTDFDRKAAGFSPDRVDALVWAMSDLLVEEISSWASTRPRKAEAVIKAKLAAADAGRPKSEPAPGSLEYQ